MKKYLCFALAMPLLFACSSDDLFEKEAVSNDQFAGIEKVDATFTMDDESPVTRMATDWTLEEGDMYGFAWLGEESILSLTGNAYQNHPLTQTGNIFKPQTSIYVGKYFLYRPYDETVVNIEAINFKSLEEQTITDGMRGQNWSSLAKNAIVIGDKWTNVTKTGDDVDGITWNKAGIDNPFKIYAAVFSNQTALDLTYEKNNVAFDGQSINGATDISYTYPAGSTIGAADIYSGTVELTGAAKSFTYAPTTEPNTGDHSGTYWADQSNLSSGFTFASGAITLNAPDENGISTDKEDNKGWFWFNSLPVTAGDASSSTNVETILETSYGTVTIDKSLEDCAYAFETPTSGTTAEWIKLAAVNDETKTPKKWKPADHNTFVNQYGNHKGKYALTVDFSNGVMNGMHIKNDAHLQKALKYYIASGKDEDVVLNLDKDANGNFEISKISIALLQTINATTNKVLVQACTDVAHTPEKIIVTQDGQAELGLADAKEVPALNKVFNAATDVILSSACEWTWAGGEDGETALPIDDNVKSITNEGKLTVNATNVQLSVVDKPLANAAGATMDITKVTTVKTALTNLGTINVGSASNTSAELRAYDVEITNDATSLEASGVINNYGVVGVSETGGTAGKFNNYGLIEMKNGDAVTLLSTNELTSNFDDAFDATTNKMGTVVLPEGNPTAIVSVNNKDANGFIKYTWPAGTSTYVTPEGNVKYNTIVVSGNIEFTEEETEIQYIEFDGTRTQVVNPTSNLKKLKGIIVNAGKSIIIEKGNQLVPKNGTFLGAGATVYNGGKFTHNANVVGTTASNYFGEWSTDQIVKY